eukprot:6196238-Pleurochrysis_carterae.AAC.4
MRKQQRVRVLSTKALLCRLRALVPAFSPNIGSSLYVQSNGVFDNPLHVPVDAVSVSQPCPRRPPTRFASRTARASRSASLPRGPPAASRYVRSNAYA